LYFIILIGINISFYIELIQLIVHVGICDIDDLIANSLGFIVGVLPARTMLPRAKQEKSTK